LVVRRVMVVGREKGVGGMRRLVVVVVVMGVMGVIGKRLWWNMASRVMTGACRDSVLRPRMGAQMTTVGSRNRRRGKARLWIREYCRVKRGVIGRAFVTWQGVVGFVLQLHLASGYPLVVGGINVPSFSSFSHYHYLNSISPVSPNPIFSRALLAGFQIDPATLIHPTLCRDPSFICNTTAPPSPGYA
jgi:hypothetical protein